MAILAAYVQRQRTGEGQVIEMSMHEVMTMFIRTTGIAAWDAEGPAAPRIGNALGAAPTDMYPCPPFGPNDYVYVMVGTPRMWDALCGVIERPDLLADERFATPKGRKEHEDLLRDGDRRVVPHEDEARGHGRCSPAPGSPRPP